MGIARRMSEWIVACLGFLAFGDAGAAEPAKFDLTQAQLRACLGLKDAVKGEDDRLAAQRKLLDVEGAKMSQLRKDIEIKRSQINVWSRASKRQFDADFAAAQEQFDAHTRAINKHNADLGVQKVQRDKFNDECARKTYRESDYKAVKADLDPAKRAQDAAVKKK